MTARELFNNSSKRNQIPNKKEWVSTKNLP